VTTRSDINGTVVVFCIKSLSLSLLSSSHSLVPELKVAAIDDQNAQL
jgi:hypothetical protein